MEDFREGDSGEFLYDFIRRIQNEDVDYETKLEIIYEAALEDKLANESGPGA